MDLLKNIYEVYLATQKVTTDSRRINEGDIFFALKGPNFNGNLFAQKALDAGASAVIIDEDQSISNHKVFLVEDCLQTLQDLAKTHRDHLDIPFIGITGSNGKTTSKELIRDVLATTYKVSATKGNLNNHIGVPLTILDIPKDTEIAIIEMGANHLKEIESLCQIAKPTLGYITNFGLAHLEGFGGPEGVIKGKSELYQYLRSNNGKAVVNALDQKQIELTEDISTYSFGKTNADVNIEDLTLGHQVKLKYNSVEIDSSLFGSYNFTNASAAIAIGLYFNVDIQSIKKAISEYLPTINRSEVKETKTNTLILDAYNANPSSLKLSVTDFLKLKGKELQLILADMFELGDYSKAEHQKIVDLITSSKVTCDVILAGKAFMKSNTPKTWKKFNTTEEVKKHISTNPIHNKSVLLKGSRGMQLETLIEFL